MMNAEHRESWLIRTGQMWKVHISLLLLSISLATYLFFNFFDGSGSQYGDSLSFISLVLSLCWFIFSIKCESCGRLVVYRMMRRNGIEAFTFKLLNSHTCPNCGYNSTRWPQDQT